MLRGNCGDHKIIFTTFRDVGKPEQVKSKHHHSFLFLCKERTSSFLYQNFISKHQQHYSCHRLQPSLLTCRVLWRWLGAMRRSWRRWSLPSGEFGDLGGEPVSVCMLIKENLRWVCLFWRRLYFCSFNFTLLLQLKMFSFASLSFTGTFGSSAWVWPSSECAE